MGLSLQNISFPDRLPENGPTAPVSKASPLGHAGQDEEHPEVNPKHQDNLEDDLSQDGLPEVECPIHHHGPELNEHHHQEGPRHLILGQRGRDVGCGRVFLERRP